MIEWLQGLSTPVLALLLIGGSTLLAVLALTLIRRAVPYEKLEANNHLADVFFSMVGVMYAVLLAFMVIAVWEDFQGANRIAQNEATTLDSIYRDASIFPGDAAQQVRQDLKRYAQQIVSLEWPAMAEREQSDQVEQTFDTVWAAFVAIEPQTASQRAFYNEMTRNLNQLHTLRHQRLLASTNGLPSLLWVVVLVGGVVTLSYIGYFGQPNFKAQLMMTAALVASVSFVVLVVLVLDNPFAGEVSVRPDALLAVLQEMARGA